jgi:HD-GYP domain-containing protein (c-di-GMP phosphodiesterase class II)
VHQETATLPSDRLRAILETVAESLGFEIRLLPLAPGNRPGRAEGEMMVPIPGFSLQAEILSPADQVPRISRLVRNLAEEMRQQETEALSLTREIVERYEQLSILFEMSERLGRAEDHGARAGAVLDTALESVGASGGCLLLEGREKTLYFSKTGTDQERRQLLALAENASTQGQTKVDERRHIAMPLAVSNRRLVGAMALGPRDRSIYRSGDLKVLTTLSAYAALLFDSDRLYQDLEDLFFGTVRSMVEAIDAKDPRTRGHSERVRQLSLLIAQDLGIDGQQSKRLELAALLHDVGKIGLPDTILNNRGELRPEQWELVKQHPQMGVSIMSPVANIEDILPAIGEHHERYDGQGYPSGKAGENINLFARIISVADAFDAMTMERTYRPTFTREQALHEVRENSGRQFDPRIANLFCQKLTVEG